MVTGCLFLATKLVYQTIGYISCWVLSSGIVLSTVSGVETNYLLTVCCRTHLFSSSSEQYHPFMLTCIQIFEHVIIACLEGVCRLIHVHRANFEVVMAGCGVRTLFRLMNKHMNDSAAKQCDNQCWFSQPKRWLSL